MNPCDAKTIEQIAKLPRDNGEFGLLEFQLDEGIVSLWEGDSGKPFFNIPTGDLTAFCKWFLGQGEYPNG